MRSISRFAAIVALAIAATGCANSSFNKAVDTNTARTQNYGEGFLEQAANDMTVVNDCWVNTKAKNADGTGCMMMSMALRMSNTFLYAFLGKPEMTRVPAAPEEIMQSIAEKGMKFALMKFGIGQVSAVVNNGQAAAYQVAAQAMAKNPIMIQPSVITGTPEGFGVLQQGGASTVNP